MNIKFIHIVLLVITSLFSNTNILFAQDEDRWPNEYKLIFSIEGYVNKNYEFIDDNENDYYVLPNIRKGMPVLYFNSDGSINECFVKDCLKDNWGQSWKYLQFEDKNGQNIISDFYIIAQDKSILEQIGKFSEVAAIKDRNETTKLLDISLKNIIDQKKILNRMFFYNDSTDFSNYSESEIKNILLKKLSFDFSEILYNEFKTILIHFTNIKPDSYPYIQQIITSNGKVFTFENSSILRIFSINNAPFVLLDSCGYGNDALSFILYKIEKDNLIEIFYERGLGG